MQQEVLQRTQRATQRTGEANFAACVAVFAGQLQEGRLLLLLIQHPTQANETHSGAKQRRRRLPRAWYLAVGCMLHARRATRDALVTCKHATRAHSRGHARPIRALARPVLAHSSPFCPMWAHGWAFVSKTPGPRHRTAHCALP
jgi:hypothetical protein